MRTLFCVLLVAGAAAASRPVHRRTDISYPEGYRRWTRVTSGLVGPKSPAFARYGGIHHIYANDAAMQGYVTGHFPQSSVIVFDVLETTTPAPDVTAEGAHRLLDVMRKDSTQGGASGGWAFDEFAGDTRNHAAVDLTACAKCHASKADHDYVFSVFKP